MRGFFGIGIYHPKKEANIGSLWRTAQILGADYLFTIGRRYREQSSDTQKATRHMPLFHFETFEDMKAHLPYDARIVAIELTEKATPLASYIHPEAAVYLLGAEDHGIPEKVLTQCNNTLILPGDRSMNVAVAGSIVIYDRITKANMRVKRVGGL